jgi:hypothetical protein
LSEGLINGPPETNTKDPLTPLNQNFATLDDLKNHYKLFINRIQQQLSTLGGGGETKLRYLDDVVGIATNPSVYDGKFLKYNHSTNKFEFSDVDITNDYWDNNDQDEVYTLSKVAIGTDHVGTGSTVLVVNGDARITGILSIGQGTVTVDGNSNEIYVSNIIVQDTIATAEGVEYATTTYVDNVVSISTFSKDYNELFNTPSLLSEFNNDVGFATVTYIDVAISNLINFAPDTLDTLNELAAALNDDENFATTVTNSLASKANLSGATFTGVVTATSGFLGNLTGDLIGEVNATAFDTNSSGVVVTGILTATSGNFSGIVTSSGANISGVVTATDFNSASDIKLKNNVTVIDKALDKVSQLDGVSFDWKDTGRSSLGVIAQDVEKVLPELVSGEENKTVNYNGLVGLLIQCVKEQQKEIEELRRLIDK